MQSVSEAWKANQEENFTSESYAEITLKVADPEASEAAEPTDNGHVYFSDTENIVKDVIKSTAKLATLEMNIWSLDGNCEILPSSSPYGENGFVGNIISDANGEFSTNPTITITFPSVVESLVPGISILWGENYGEYADSFDVTISNGGTVVFTKSVTGNTDINTVIDEDIAQYDEVVIEITKWCLPFRRARIKEVVVGIIKTFEKNDIMSLSNEFSVDPLSAALPLSQIRFVLKNLNGEFNSENPSGFAKYIMERQRVTARYGYKIDGAKEWISGGMYYLSEWEMPQNGITATFTARDALEYMRDTYTGDYAGKTLYYVADAAFNQANMPTLFSSQDRWVIDNSLKLITIPNDAQLENASISTVLQYVANAGCCVFYQDRGGVLHIEPLDDIPTDYVINGFLSYENANTEYIKQLKAVNINDGKYVLNVSSYGDTQSVNNPFISDAQAPTVAAWIRDNLITRKSMSGNFRADPRLDALDVVEVDTPYTNNNAVITEITYTYNGAFNGKYNARCI